MINESGRSLVEMTGVLAITGIMTASAIMLYNTIRTNQIRTFATNQLQETAKNVKILLENRNDYTGVSVDYLIKAGALKDSKAPIGTDWTITASIDKESFSINLFNVSKSDCNYFSVAVPKWAEDMTINGITLTDNDNCYSGATNNISFIVK